MMWFHFSIYCFFAEESRIPTMAMGTPLEDAERRDFTLNSLFFNLQTWSIEDMTGRGVEDLEQGEKGVMFPRSVRSRV